MPYHQFTNEDGEAYGSFEVFEHPTQYDLNIYEYASLGAPDDYYPGWHWWACFPGCLPDGDPCGPFDTEEAAIADAKGE